MYLLFSTIYLYARGPSSRRSWLRQGARCLCEKETTAALKGMSLLSLQSQVWLLKMHRETTVLKGGFQERIKDFLIVISLDLIPEPKLEGLTIKCINSRSDENMMWKSSCQTVKGVACPTLRGRTKRVAFSSANLEVNFRGGHISRDTQLFLGEFQVRALLLTSSGGGWKHWKHFSCPLETTTLNVASQILG